jgi:hypothetical protein
VAGRIDGVALGAVGAGALFIYAGLKGKSVLAALQAIVRGKAPSSAPSSAGSSSGTFLGIPGINSSALPAAGGTTYTQGQLAQLWTANGGSAAQAPNAACHGIQESGGNALITSGNPDGGTNVGLWQLDTRGVGAGYTVAELQNPQTNARLTVLGTRNGTDWSNWATPGC